MDATTLYECLWLRSAVFRGLHIGRHMMDLALELARAADKEITLHAQSYLENWYGDFGFVVTGPHFDEAGIDHVPMTLGR